MTVKVTAADVTDRDAARELLPELSLRQSWRCFRRLGAN
ncbi:hypothetical protein BKA14_002692 [Actinoplanes abujensis]|uniref:Uncharacterized protein n=1 Tax=Paractinoplanes abujensis TaxID=882441 RepID=A0A7W7G1D6_9ACTN|nr:hypothetical protein [Actinoplanes abujensis]